MIKKKWFAVYSRHTHSVQNNRHRWSLGVQTDRTMSVYQCMCVCVCWRGVCLSGVPAVIEPVGCVHASDQRLILIWVQSTGGPSRLFYSVSDKYTDLCCPTPSILRFSSSKTRDSPRKTPRMTKTSTNENMLRWDALIWKIWPILKSMLLYGK